MRQEGRMAKRRSYTKEEREAVVADVPALGVTEAAKKHRIDHYMWDVARVHEELLSKELKK